MKRQLNVSAALLALAAAVLPGSAYAADRYPSKPVRLVVPFAAGGAVDATARILGNRLQAQFGQPVIIENRPGVGGNLAADHVAKATADGYTILQTTVGQAISPSMFKSLSYNAEKDLAPVTQLVESGLLLVATPKLAAGNLKELIALAKSKPGALNYGNTGVGNPLHLAMEMLKRETGMEIQGVPFRGDAPLTTALISGDIQVAIVPLATALGNVSAGLIKALAVSTATRNKALPTLSTIAEQGLPGFAADSWQGLFVPAATPGAVIQRIYEETRAALLSPEVKARLDKFGSEVVASPPDRFAAKFKADMTKYARIVEAAKIPRR